MTGPVDIAVISFPGNKFNGDVVPALKALVDDGTVRILDLVFVNKDAEGNVQSIEINDAEAYGALGFDDIDEEIDDLLTEEDIASASELLERNSSAALIVWENTWAERFAKAVRDSNGHLVAYERIPAAAIQATIEYHKQLTEQVK
ncbi:MAG: DUF6325 family protein [Anaerolineae bacterium]|jgi:hypothetical protein|nr:DUF6325 family protein [Anaerolineae bacterium]